MTQQLSKNIHSSILPARSEVVEKHIHKPVLKKTNTLQFSAGTSLQSLKDRFVKWGVCKCPLEFQKSYRPYKTDYTEKQCLICGNLSGRKYD